VSAEFFRYLDTFVERLRDGAGDAAAMSPAPGRERLNGDAAIRPLSANAERALAEMFAGLRETSFAGTNARVDADDCKRIFSYLVNAAAGAVAGADAEMPLDDAPRPCGGAGGIQVRLELLSGCAFADGIPVEIPPRELAVLTYLAIHRRPRNRDAITDAVWPEHDPAVAAKNLKVIVHRARRRLGDSVIQSSRDGYVLGAAVVVDLRDAESLVRAAARESALPGAYGRPLQALVRSCRARDRAALMRYDWYVALDGRLRELERDAVLQICRRANVAGDAATALALSSDLLAIDPADELACESSITARLSIPDFTGARRDLRAFAAAVRAAGDEVALKRMEKTFARMLDRIEGAIASSEGSTS
jgi:DNA-binding SARP family transcriptional activator